MFIWAIMLDVSSVVMDYFLLLATWERTLRGLHSGCMDIRKKLMVGNLFRNGLRKTNEGYAITTV